MACWNWCTLKHKHVFTKDSADLYTTKEYLSADERKKIYYQTGQHFENYSEFRRWCKNNGRRCIERGEEQDRLRKAHAEWVDGGCKGEAPGKWTPDPRQRPSAEEWMSSG